MGDLEYRDSMAPSGRRYSSPVTGLEWPRGFQEVKVKQSRYRPGVGDLEYRDSMAPSGRR